jgi:hypothetical protein
MSVDYIIERDDGSVVSFPPRPWCLEAINLMAHAAELDHWKTKSDEEVKRLRQENSVLIVRAKGESIGRGEILHLGPNAEVQDLCSALFQAFSTAGMGIEAADGSVVPDRLPGDPICVSIPSVLEGLRTKTEEEP